MDKKNKKRYCIDEKINRQVRRARMRTKTGIILFLSATLVAAVCFLVFIISSIFCITK
jgi:hypothetical protein